MLRNDFTPRHGRIVPPAPIEFEQPEQRERTPGVGAPTDSAPQARNLLPGGATAHGVLPSVAQTARPAPRRRRRWPLVAAVVALATAVGAGTTWWLQREDHGPADLRSVVLPASLSGIPNVQGPYNFGADRQWAENVRDIYGQDHAFGGQSYMVMTSTGRPQPPMLNLVIARGYFPDGPDLELARPPFTRIGSVTCTKTVNLDLEDDDAPPVTTDNMTLCFRAEQTLTVSVLGISSTLTTETVAAAVEQAWAAQ